MPLSPEQKKQLIAAQGFDPASHYMDETSGDIFEGVDPSASVQNTEISLSPPTIDTSPKSSATKVFAKSALSNLGPSIAAIGGGALAAQAFPGAHVFPPWSEIGAGLVGAVATGYGASKAQDALLPDAAKSAIYPTEQEVTEHPIAATVGEIAPNLLAFNPIKSLGSLAKAGGLIKNLATSPISSYANLTAAEAAALRNFGLNTGVNVGANTGINIAQQLAGDQPFNYGSLAKDAALGVILNEPTKLGQRYLGFQPSFSGVTPRAEIDARPRAPKPAPPEVVEPSFVEGNYGTEFNEPNYQINFKEKGADNKYLVSDADTDRIFKREYPRLSGKDKLEGTGLTEDQIVGLTTEQKRDFLDLVMRRRTDLSEDFGYNPVVVDTSVVTPPSIPEPTDFYSKPKAKGKSVDIRERQEFGAGGKGPYKYSETPSTQNIEADVADLFRKRGITPGQYRVTITDAQGNPVIGPRTGKEIAGRAKVSSRTVDLGKSAGGDTVYHETGHVYLNDLVNSKDARDNALVTKAFSEIGYPELTAAEFKRLNAEENNLRAQGKTEEADAVRQKYIGAEEELMDFVGFEGYTRKTTGGFKQYLKDYLSRFSMGKAPAKQQLSARLEHEVPYGSTERIGPKEPVKVEPKVLAPDTEKLSEEPIKKSDYQQYLDVQAKISEKIKAGDYESPEFQALWKENEVIKNRNGGMPPSKPMDDAPKLQEESGFEREPNQREKEYIKIEARDIVNKGKPVAEAEYKPQDISDVAKSPEEYQKANIVSRGIEKQLGDASLKASQQSVKAQKNLNDVVKADLPSETAFRDMEEVNDTAVKKAEELEAFTRSDVERNQEESSVEKNPNLLVKKPLLDVFTSVTDKIASGKTDKTSTKVSRKLRNYFDESESKQGEYGQSIALLLRDYDSKVVNDFYRRRWEIDNGLASPRELSGKDKELNDAYQKLIQRPKEDAQKLGLKVKRGEDYYTIGGIKADGYLPNIMDPEVIYKLDNDPSSIDAKRARRQWKEWLVSKDVDPKEAVEMIANWERARREYGDTGGPEFKALRKPEGYGLPWELIDKNPVRAHLRYGRRAANDIAYFKHIQNDPEMLYALGVKDQYGKNPEPVEGIDYIGNEKSVQDAMKFVWGKNRVENPRLAAFSRLAGNVVMGTGTAIRNIASIPAQLSMYDVKFKDVFKGIANISNARKKAYESGAVRVNPSDYEYLGELGNPDPWIKNLDKASAILRKWQGRDASDKLEGVLLYSIGEEWAKTNVALAKKGNTEAKRMLQRATGEEEFEDISKIAKGFVNLVRGSYGPQGLPNWALAGNIAPFVALNRYGIEKWNNVYKDVVMPLKNGNVMPFLKYTLTGVLTGAAIEELNEAIAGRKGSDLNVAETLKAYSDTQDPELLASKVIGLAQLSAYAGMVGDLAKLSMRAAEGKDMSYSNPLSFPLYTLATETIGENVSAAIGAIRGGEDPIEVMTQFVKSVPLQSIQALRYIQNRGEEGQRKEEYADLRKYKEAKGETSREELELGKPNPYEGVERRKFKRTGDIDEASKILPSLIEKAIEKANGDPYKLKAEFRKLKQSSYQSLPDPKNQPLAFWEYIQYLTDTQGPEVASSRISKFFTQKYLNQAKAAMVP